MIERSRGFKSHPRRLVTINGMAGSVVVLGCLGSGFVVTHGEFVGNFVVSCRILGVRS